MVQLLRIAFGAITAMVVLAGLLMRGSPDGVAPAGEATHHAGNPWAYGAPAPSAGTPVAAAASGSISIMRDGSGQFHVDALVNGQDTRFLVDTGADTVAISEAEAQRLGIDLAGVEFEPIVQTASGRGMAARVTIDRLSLGGAELGGVSALVIKELPVNLLGQSVLRRLGRVELAGDRMVIQPG